MALPPFDMEDFKKQLEQAAADNPPPPHVDWAMALSVNMLRVLDRERSGFRADVRDQIMVSVSKMEASEDPDERARAPLLAELAESWVFTG